MTEWIETRPMAISSLSFSVFLCLFFGTHFLHAESPLAILGAVAVLTGMGGLICINFSFRRVHETMTRLERRLAESAPEPDSKQVRSNPPA